MSSESFTHDLIMDVDAAQETWDIMRTHQKAMDAVLTEILTEIESGLLISWQGEPAYEFFCFFYPLYERLAERNQELQDLHSKFLEEIDDWIEMSRTLSS